MLRLLLLQQSACAPPLGFRYYEGIRCESADCTLGDADMDAEARFALTTMVWALARGCDILSPHSSESDVHFSSSFTLNTYRVAYVTRVHLSTLISDHCTESESPDADPSAFVIVSNNNSEASQMTTVSCK